MNIITYNYFTDIATTRKLPRMVAGMHDKHQTIEEPCEVKTSRTVLKTSRTGDSLAEFNRV
jgi:hypothetical protein